LGFAGIKGIRHVIVDEGQDYSAFHYEVMKRLFTGASFTILGDLNQSIHPYMHIEDYESITGILGDEGVVRIQLDTSYRSTREIVRFTRAILPDGNPVDYIDRRGNKPRVIKAFTDQGLHDALAGDIEDLRQRGAGWVAVICKTAREADSAFAALKDKVEITLIRSDDVRFRTEVVIMPSYLSKGLEFDAVLVYDASATSYCKDNERKLFYTVCTRALHDLHIYYSGEPSPFIPAPGTGLYETHQQ